jgi:alcohol dehydrogenase (cytochrome c)
LKWFYQFTPHDTNDWDAAQVPVLADLQWHGVPRKVMLWANRNGIAYVLDRATGEFLFAKPFVDVNWMDGFDAKGRPISTPHKNGIAVRPAIGGTNWYPPSFSPVTGLFYIPALEESSPTGQSGRSTPSRAKSPGNSSRIPQFSHQACCPPLPASYSVVFQTDEGAEDASTHWTP